jgi:hypothetical protein
MGDLITIGRTQKQWPLSDDARRAVLYHCQQLRLRIAERKCNAGADDAAALARGERELIALVGLLIGPPAWYSSEVTEA